MRSYMPSIEKNIEFWKQSYDWSGGGDEWSRNWGGPDMQWYATLLPRMQAFLPAKAILEIAPGFGRWTQFLRDLCETLIGVDLNENCVESCKSRFASSPNLQFFVNDGKSLPMVRDESIDFIVSFDSLVHVEADVIDAYLKEFRRVLTKNGVGVIHHSNYGNCLPTRPMRKFRRVLSKLAPINNLNPHWRAESMTAEKFADSCRRHDLQCISQEMINWDGNVLCDCISVFTNSQSEFRQSNVITKNRRFMKEAANAKAMSSMYGRKRFDRNPKDRNGQPVPAVAQAPR